MDPVQSRASRVARGWIAGSFATGVAAVSHGLADGAAPSILSLAVALVFAGLLGTLAIGRRPSLPRLTVIVGISQLAFHVVFSFLTPGTAEGVSGHHAVPDLVAPAVAHHGDDPVMWIGHTLAGVATIAFLAKAERALWGLLRETLRAAIRPRPLVLPVRHRRPGMPHVVAPRHPSPAPFLSALSHRGPPAVAGA